MIKTNSGVRVSRKATSGHKIKHEEHHASTVKPISEIRKQPNRPTRGRRGRRGKKRGGKSSASPFQKTFAPSNEFKPIINQRRPKILKPLDRNPRQQPVSTFPADPLRIIMSNQIVQVSQEKDRRYHFE